MKKIPAPRPNAARAEPEIAVHLQRREPDVRSIEKIEDVEHEHERHQRGSPRDRRVAIVSVVASASDVVARTACRRGDGQK